MKYDPLMLREIEDILVNGYGVENEPFTKKELRELLDSIVDVFDRNQQATLSKLNRRR